VLLETGSLCPVTTAIVGLASMMSVTEYQFAVAVAMLCGLMVGSFLNVVIYRVPRGISVARPRSFCPACKVPIRPLDNIPVLSWCLLRGRCRSCHAPISSRYLAVEVLTGIAWGMVTAWQLHGIALSVSKSLYDHIPQLAALLILVSVLVAAGGMIVDRVAS
jgi:leader peptidase (prepilin peptidase)/N-methyltransferase